MINSTRGIFKAIKDVLEWSTEFRVHWSIPGHHQSQRITYWSYHGDGQLDNGSISERSDKGGGATRNELVASD